MSSTVVVEASAPHPSTLASTCLASVRRHARTAPDRIALLGDGAAISYAELWHGAMETAVGLGDRPGVVGVDAVHDPATVIALLGVWAAGGTYCPIDPSFPQDHVDTMLAAVGGRRLGVGTPRPEQLGRAADVRAAYVLFTSGSTGRPKPVAVPHRALDAVVPALRDLFGITRHDRVLQFASLNWDTSFEEILPTLVAGARVVFGGEAHTGSLPRLLRLVEHQAISVLDLPTSMWHELVLHLSEGETGLPDSVRLVVIGGEAVNLSRLAAWRTLPGSARIRLLNTHGATETALITHAIDLHGPVGTTEGTAIGRPLAHVVQRVTGDGELLVGGPSLAVGYPGLPDATAERFVEIDGVRYFRTGDLVRRTSAGVVHHIGRLDAQVKVRGIRVDPGEVEAHLTRHPGVAAAAVTGVEASHRTALAAYVVTCGPQPVDGRGSFVSDLRGYLRAQVPGHLHPSRITIVPELAFTGSGKVDRRATHERFGAIRRAGPTALTRTEETTT